MKHSITDQLKQSIQSDYRDNLFTIKDLIDLGSYDTIKRLLIRLEHEKYIVRVIDGIYMIPKYSKLTGELVPITAHEVALKIADKFSWKIIPTGNLALNILGISDQVPVKYEYLSTGPYRDFEYHGKTIKFKNTQSKEISELSYELALIVSAIKTLGKDNITSDIIKKISTHLNGDSRRMILNETKKVTIWIFEVIQGICAHD